MGLEAVGAHSLVPRLHKHKKIQESPVRIACEFVEVDSELFASCTSYVYNHCL